MLAELEVVLEAYEVVAVGAEVLLAELDYGVGPAAGLGVGEAYGLHGAEAEGVAAAAGGLFDGEAAFEVLERRGVRGEGPGSRVRGAFVAAPPTHDDDEAVMYGAPGSVA